MQRLLIVCAAMALGCNSLSFEKREVDFEDVQLDIQLEEEDTTPGVDTTPAEDTQATLDVETSTDAADASDAPGTNMAKLSAKVRSFIITMITFLRFVRR